jgi:hypothetical protein
MPFISHFFNVTIDLIFRKDVILMKKMKKVIISALLLSAIFAGTATSAFADNSTKGPCGAKPCLQTP